MKRNGKLNLGKYGLRYCLGRDWVWIDVIVPDAVWCVDIRAGLPPRVSLYKGWMDEDPRI